MFHSAQQSFKSECGPLTGQLLSAAATSPLASALSAAQIGVWQIDMSNGLATWDAVTNEMLGYGFVAQKEPKALPLHPDDKADAVRRMTGNLLNDDGGDRDFELRVICANGEVRWIRSTARRPGAEQAPGKWLVGIVTDVTDRKLTEMNLVNSQSRLAAVLEGTQDCVISLDESCRFTYLNEMARKYFDQPDELVGRSILDVLPGGEDSEFGKSFSRVLTTREPECLEAFFPPTGRWYEARVSAIEGGVTLFFRDISKRVRAEQEVRWTVSHDSLTRIGNRALLQQRMDQRLEESAVTGARFALLLVDIDEFKTTNDTLGHDAGDALLCEFAERLERATRADDTVARLGGDEFAVILNGVESAAEAEAAVASIFDALREPCFHAGRLLQCRASMGISLYPSHGTNRAQLLKNADIAMYAAKAAGRGNLNVFRPIMRG